MGAGPETLAQVAEKPAAGMTKPMFIVGAAAFARPDGSAVLASLAKAALAAGVVKDGWNGFNVLHTAASRVGGLDLGLVPGDGGLDAPSMAKAGALDVLFNLGADEIDVEPGAFVVYIGTHGDRGAHRADVILPGAAYTEKTGIYVNTEGRPQFAERAVFPPGDAREDWSILRALSEPLGAQAPLRFARAVARDARRRLSPSRALRRDRARRSCGDRRPVVGGRNARQGPVLQRGPRLLPHQPDRPRVAHHGRMLGPGAFARAASGGIGQMSSASPSRPGSSPSLAVLGVGALVAAVVVVALLWFLIGGGYFAAFGRWMHTSDVGTALRYVLESLLLLVCLLLSTAALIYLERKIWGSVHLRRGPNVVGPWGVLQPFADFLKFILKEPIIPASANKGVFVLAPLVSVVLAIAAWAVIPLADGWVISDINVGILYLFAVSSLGVYGVIMAGWASNSKYPLLVGFARRGADGVLRSLDRLRDRHRGDVRRVAEPQRHRARPGHAASASSAGTGCRSCRCSSSSSSRRWPRPTVRRST